MNSFGTNFRITVFGESHGRSVGVVVDGISPGIGITEEDFRVDLDRRRSGGDKGGTLRCERDTPHIISGICNGHTTGAPLTVIFENSDTKSEDYSNLRRHPRPSHADRVASLKYNGFNDAAGGGMFSGRMTVALVAAGVVAKKMVEPISFAAKLVEIGGEEDTERFEAMLNRARDSGDSVGGVVEITAGGVPAGLGEPFFCSVESLVAHLMFSIPGVKGVEFGAGFRAARKRGSENNDLITDREGRTATNNDGGINGGISNGNDITVRVAFKPAPSIAVVQNTYNYETDSIEPLRIKGRHDACIAVRGAAAAEAALAIVLADLSWQDGRLGYRRSGL